MDAGRLSEVENLFHETRRREPAERAAFLDGACRSDLALRAEVESLLTHAADETSARPSVASSSRLQERGPLQEGPGSVIGPYKLLQPLGEGGFGAVYMAEQRDPVRRRVALKIIKLGMDTKQVIARFEAERQALALMDHPNIAKVLDAGATQTGRPYFVMELVRGVPITEYCDKAGMRTEDRLRLFVLVCRAVQHAHHKGIVHRDIKPSNILVTLHDGEPVPKVIDFGIAKAINQELTEKTVFTEFRQFIGTPEYMSPEQAEMSGLDIDTRADVYSLGVLLYELLTGTTPVDPLRLRTAGYEEMQRILREEEALRPSTRLSTMGALAAVVARKRGEEPVHLARSLRGDLDWIVLKSLEKDRSRRYETAAGFALDIERHLKDEPVVASPPSRSYKLRKFVRRNRGSVTAAAIVVAVLLLGITGTTAGFLRARQALAGEQDARNVAEISARQALEEAARQRALAGFFESSLISTGPWRFGSSAPARVVDLLDLAAARLAAGEMDDQPATKAVLAYAIGYAYLDRDHWEKALEHLRMTVDGLGDGSADPLTFSRAAMELDRIDAEPYFDLEASVDVAGLRERAVAALEPLVQEGDPAAADQLLEWSHVLFLRELHAEAAGVLRTLLALVRTQADPVPSCALVEFNLASAEARLGNDEEARRLYASSTRGLREMVTRGDAEAADDWLQRCEHPAIGLCLDTDPPLQEVMDLARTRHTARNLGMAESLWNLAWIGEDIGFGEKSYEAMRECVEIARGFEENHLMLGSALVDLAYLEWKRGRTDEVIEHCLEARPLLSATRGQPRMWAEQLIVSCLAERIAADPKAPETADRLRQIEELAAEAAGLLAHAHGIGSRDPWWHICAGLARAHQALAAAESGSGHAELTRAWMDRLRSDVMPYLDTPFARNHDRMCTMLASAILLLDDASRDELETAHELAARADEITGGRLTGPVDTLAQALFRLGDIEGAVREARRALALSKSSEPVRGLEDRVERYEAALAGGR